MWQYYKVALVKKDRVKIITPDGWKMMEHSYYGNHSMERIEYLLSLSHYKVMWIWDYSQVAPFAWEYYREDQEDMFEYEKDWVEYSRLKHEKWKYYYLVNYTKKEFINMNWQEENEDLKDNFGWVVHPLSLLCRAETEDAWWDYRSEYGEQYIWYWCWDEIWVLDNDTQLDYALEHEWFKDRSWFYIFKE